MISFLISSTTIDFNSTVSLSRNTTLLSPCQLSNHIIVFLAIRVKNLTRLTRKKHFKPFLFYPKRSAAQVSRQRIIEIELGIDYTTEYQRQLVANAFRAGFALIGLGDDSLSRLLIAWWRWKRGKRIITFRGTPPESKKHGRAV